MKALNVDFVLDAKGLACPMPIVKTKKAMNEVEAGQVIEVQATDKGSLADIKAWAESTGHQYLGSMTEGEVLYHYLRKATNDEVKSETKHPVVASNEELEQKLAANESIVVVDVREEAEYAFNHIPNAVSIPLGQLEERLNELDKNADIYVVCRTGSRSDFAAQKLAENGFMNVTNVVPGMSAWKGTTESINN
ncbi:sulfurtransferase TusA family protein [Mesobacillus maritimus]|uniref:sulfurtransferase TusA family protein n=1 Tax=Mesobacillus maritimus TaxID=1643336 RepID=UPI00203B4C0F|nr:sulfurtransferase TusA family protein [Mesobacillus maritimus]MCM3585820.1 sulfurtransferase TusA family protein [Mesobacillus maritimus]MCM3670580.1 sulfurtransferase TusA family protein [Mesobacillus maritimus]